MPALTQPRRALLAFCLAASFALPTAHAQRNLSEASGLSGMPVAISVVGGAIVLAAGSELTVKAVKATAEGVSWVVERAADGASATIQLSGQAAQGASVAAGTALTVSVIGTGWVLSKAGQAVAFVPNEIGRALLHNERVSR
ncbi:MAG: hypothetical protein ACKVQR_24185 [Aquabacterium sp.]